jgi:endonuclease/exonuclease/phosphatase family metal-dependent hydrolase
VAPSSLALGSWNLQWFGSDSEGPSDDEGQLWGVRDVVDQSGIDVWGLCEVANAAQFQRLAASLPNYEGLLGAPIEDGQQGLAVLYRAGAVLPRASSLILADRSYDFGGRPPLEVTFDLAPKAASRLVVIVLHAKAFADLGSWQRRQRASLALQAYLDATYPSQQVIVLGDFNDDVVGSITPERESPYDNFVADARRYSFATADLSREGLSSTLHSPAMIDHHLVTNELAARYLDGSAELLDVEDYGSAPAQAVSDHHPVVSHYER